MHILRNNFWTQKPGEAERAKDWLVEKESLETVYLSLFPEMKGIPVGWILNSRNIHSFQMPFTDNISKFKF